MSAAASIVAAIACALPVCAQSGIAPEILQLSRIRHHAANDLSHLPNFTCLETIERATRQAATARFQVQDSVRIEVAYVNEHELFAWPGASKFENKPLSDFVSTGLSSTGDFGSHARSVFVNTSAVIRYAGEEDLDGHRAARYTYEISPAFSGFKVIVSGQSGIAGVRGSFWADTKTYDLLRLTVEGVDIPEDLGVREMTTAIDYGRLRIASGDYLLPKAAEVWLAHVSGFESRNRTEFTNCREYTTESVLSFETPEPGPPVAALSVAAPAPPAIAELTLPAGLHVPLKLETPINPDKAKIGDELSAGVTTNLKHNNSTIVPKGAIVSGRLRVLQKQSHGYTVGIEFTGLTFGNKHAQFAATLVSARVLNKDIELRPSELPGVSVLFINEAIGRLPKGTLMVWRTEAP